MNVQVENLPNCIATLRVEVPAEKVAQEKESIVLEYVKHAKLPGYRAGKVPRTIVETRFKKEIKEELQSRLLSQGCREAISQNGLRVVTVSNIDDVEIGLEGTMQFTATVVKEPEFELPDYKNLTVQLKSTEVTEADIDQALENLRDQYAEFKDLEGRALQADDFAIIDYTGTIDGKPVSEVVPKAGRPLSGNEDFWIRLTKEAFFPGFSEQIYGANIGETRTFQLEVPADFPVKELAGLKIEFSVKVKAIKEKTLPAIDDAFASKVIANKTLAELRDIAKSELGRQKEAEAERERKNQVMTQLLAKVECELPNEMVRLQTQQILSEIVRENQARGISDDLLKQSEKDLVAAAGQGARERVKGSFILSRIAQAEKLTVTKEDVFKRVADMARQYQVTIDKALKDIQKNNVLPQIQEEILNGKTLDFLSASATVQTVDAPAGAAA